MDSLDQLNEEIKNLKNAISRFHQGARTLRDFKPIEKKIQDLRYDLRALKTRILVYQARIEMISAPTAGHIEDNLRPALKSLNSSHSNFIVSRNCIENVLINETISRIRAREVGSQDIADKVNKLLKILFDTNEKNTAKIERKKVLVDKRLKLKLEYREQVFLHQQFLEAQRGVEAKELENMDSTALNTKQKIIKLIYKINYMKKLVTNMIAGADETMTKNHNFHPFLIKHKHLVTRKNIEDEIRQIECSQNSRRS